MKHVMIDIETLSLSTSAVVTQIGACAWDSDHDGIGPGLILSPTFEDQSDRKIDASTVMFWMSQDDAARASIVGADRTVTKTLAHIHLVNFLDQVTIANEGNPPTIWAMGPQFDIVVLESYFAGMTPLWKYRQIADARTLRLVYDGPTYTPVIAHNAYEDAVAQARWVRDALKALGAR